MQFNVLSVAQGRKRRVKILQRDRRELVEEAEVKEEVNEKTQTSEQQFRVTVRQWLIEM